MGKILNGHYTISYIHPRPEMINNMINSVVNSYGNPYGNPTIPPRKPTNIQTASRFAEIDIPIRNTLVLCDIDDTDLSDDTRSGGFMFGSYAVGPCCAERYLESIRGYGEEWNIRARCPEGVSFADWVRDMRGPDAAITITPGLPGTWRP